MHRRGGRVITGRDDQLQPLQVLDRALDGAFGQTGGFREHAQTRRHGPPFSARGLAIEVQIDEIRGWLIIVPDNVSHQNIEHVIIDWHNFSKTRHNVVTRDK